MASCRKWPPSVAGRSNLALAHSMAPSNACWPMAGSKKATNAPTPNSTTSGGVIIESPILAARSCAPKRRDYRGWWTRREPKGLLPNRDLREAHMNDSVSLSHRLSRFLSRAYPPSFYAEYGGEMALTFRDSCRAEYRQHGALMDYYHRHQLGNWDDYRPHLDRCHGIARSTLDTPSRRDRTWPRRFGRWPWVWNRNRTPARSNG